jgi:hypothetical protein
MMGLRTAREQGYRAAWFLIVLLQRPRFFYGLARAKRCKL